MDKFVGYQKLNERIELTSDNEQSVEVHGKELLIRKVEKTTDGIQVTIATEQNLLLDGVAIQAKGTSTPLYTILGSEHLERRRYALQ